MRSWPASDVEEAERQGLMNEDALVPSLGPIDFVFNTGGEQSCGVEQSCKSLGLSMDLVRIKCRRFSC
jgi:hypothetical protein